MGRIYLNEKDREVLICIKNKLKNIDDIEFINGLLEQEKKQRLHFNKVASVYKKTKRAENVDFARSKKEIAKRKSVKCHS